MIHVVAHDPAWPAMFDAERDRLAAALAAVAVRIEHVGSTAVPGLAAKPWIDIQVEVTDLAQPDCFHQPLLALGYTHHPDLDDHEFYDMRPYHVHVCQAGGEWARRHVAFRDLLRSDPAARAEYQAEKIRLAQQLDDVHAYTDAKTPIIRSLEARRRPRHRLDAALVERGLAETRSRAQALVMAGRVTVDGAVVDKAGAPVAAGAVIEVTRPPRFVSRGGDKLETAMARWQVDVTG
jgi:GrpB-like predicted nucleotidyltransferase (UPF0157 family)